MVRKIISGEYPDQHSVLIAKCGRLVVEEYFYEYDAAMPHQLRSATKSFCSALVGIAIDRGLIERVAGKVFPCLADAYGPFQPITHTNERKTTEEHLPQQ